jgi:hypothetical protein
MKIRFVPSSGVSKPTGAFNPLTKLEGSNGGGGTNCGSELGVVVPEFPPQLSKKIAALITTVELI